MPNRYGTLGVFDSGIGGLSVANAISGLLPRENIRYFADNAYAPYGPRPAAEIRRRSFAIVADLLAGGSKLIVVACNTATSLAIDALRERWPGVPFVGMEPAVKPAARAHFPLVLATRATLASPRYAQLRERFLGGGRPLREDHCPGLVPLIEADDPGLDDYLRELLRPALAAGVDSIVLGCTHYPLIADRIRAVAGPGVALIDPSPAAARQVARLLDHHALATPAAAQPPRYDFHCSGGPAALQRALLRLPALNAHRRWLLPQ